MTTNQQNPAAVQQPPPKAGEEIVLNLVVKDLQDRAEVGLKKYGTYLKTQNGRDALMDAYQEALDLAMYLRQAIEARLKVERLSESLGGAVGGSVAIIQAQLRKAAEDQASAEKAIASLEQSVNRQSKQIDVRDIVGKVKEIAATVKTDFSFEFKRNILRLFNVQVQVMERGPIYTRRAEVRLNAILGDDAAFVLECI